VLEPAGAEERRAINGLLDPMAQAVECWLVEGIEPAMNRYNRRGELP
jgi:peptidyl-tRNA hydrolase